jgi:hypothetical protein
VTLRDDVSRKISEFVFEQYGAEKFRERLQRENSWTPEFTEKVINEYRRFLVLVVNADHPVAPSDAVDQAWHLHLTFTRSYWEGLCAEIVGRPIHHTPSVGGPDERAKFKKWYGDTLRSYSLLFGHEPPSDIWPSAELRFENSADFVRIDRSRHWIVSRPRPGAPHLFGSKRWVPLLAIGSTGAVVTGFGGLRWLESSGLTLLGSLGPLVLGAGFVVLLSATTKWFGGRCPRCRRRRALKKTGQRRVSKDREEENWACRHCGCTVWAKVPTDDGCGCG